MGPQVTQRQTGIVQCKMQRSAGPHRVVEPVTAQLIPFDFGLEST
jgi:hypothetical protein